MESRSPLFIEQKLEEFMHDYGSDEMRTTYENYKGCFHDAGGYMLYSKKALGILQSMSIDILDDAWAELFLLLVCHVGTCGYGASVRCQKSWVSVVGDYQSVRMMSQSETDDMAVMIGQALERRVKKTPVPGVCLVDDYISTIKDGLVLVTTSIGA